MCRKLRWLLRFINDIFSWPYIGMKYFDVREKLLEESYQEAQKIKKLNRKQNPIWYE